jgi:hypothetical protein
LPRSGQGKFVDLEAVDARGVKTDRLDASEYGARLDGSEGAEPSLLTRERAGRVVRGLEPRREDGRRLAPVATADSVMPISRPSLREPPRGPSRETVERNIRMISPQGTQPPLQTDKNLTPSPALGADTVGGKN